MTQETFERELSHRADAVHGAPLSFEDVRGRALSIRRRRRAAVAGGVAAAVALVAIVPTVLGGEATRSDDVDPAPAPREQAAVLEDGRVMLPDGDVRVDVATESVSTWVVLDDGRVVVARNDPGRVDVYSATGERQDYPVGSTAVVGSASGDAAAWLEEDWTVRVLPSGVAEPVALGTVEVDPMTGAMIDAVLGPDRVLVGDGNTTTTEVTTDGVRPLVTSEPFRVSSASPDGARWAVQYAGGLDPQHGCAGIYDPEATRMVARSCETALLRFSPDGTHLTGAVGDGGTWSSVEVLDRDLREVLSYDPAGRQVVKDWGWSDDRHLLVVVSDFSDDPQWSLVRVPIDGAPAEVVSGPTPGPSPDLGAQILLSD